MQVSTQGSRRKWLTAYAPLLVWAALILVLGSSVGAMSETSRIIRPLLEFLFPSAAPETLTTLHGYVRKSAHVIEYAVLAVLALRAFTDKKASIFAALSVVLAVATADELNQSFNSSRTGSAYDVLLDMVGGIVGVTTFYTVKLLKRRLTTSPLPRG